MRTATDGMAAGSYARVSQALCRTAQRRFMLKRAHPLGDLGTDPLDQRVEEVDMGELLGAQETRVRPEPASEGLLQLGDLLTHAPEGELGHSRHVGRALNQRGHHVSPRAAHDVYGHRSQLDVRTLEHLLHAIDLRRPFVH